MTDKDLLHHAAIVAGVGGRQDDDGSIWIARLEQWWNPLNSDADAFRLAVTLGRSESVELFLGIKFAIVDFDCGRTPDNFIEHYSNDDNGDQDFAAVRRAIVRAAAEIGKERDK